MTGEHFDRGIKHKDYRGTESILNPNISTQGWLTKEAADVQL